MGVPELPNIKQTCMFQKFKFCTEASRVLCMKARCDKVFEDTEDLGSPVILD